MDPANPLLNASFRKLFAAQVIALVGTGMSTVALTLLAYDLAGGNAAAVLGLITTGPSFSSVLPILFLIGVGWSLVQTTCKSSVLVKIVFPDRDQT